MKPLIVGVAAVAVFAALFAYDKRAPVREETREEIAMRYCEAAVREVVRSPDTFRRLPGGGTSYKGEATLLDYPADITRTIFEFTSVNAFNAPLRSIAACEMSWLRIGKEPSRRPGLQALLIDGRRVDKATAARIGLSLQNDRE